MTEVKLSTLFPEVAKGLLKPLECDSMISKQHERKVWVKRGQKLGVFG